MVFKKFVKRIKNRLKPSVRSQIKKEVKNNTQVEHAFIKAPREKISNVSKKQSLLSVKFNNKEVKKYIAELLNKGKKVNPKKLYEIHTHVKKSEVPDFPSVKDLIKIPITKSKNPNIIFITDRKGNEIGRIHFKYEPKNRVFLKEISQLNRFIDINAEKILNKQMSINEFYKKFSFLSKEVIDMQMIKYSKKIKKNKLQGQDIIDFYKEIGFTFKIISNKSKYTYDINTIKFIKK